MSTTVVTDLRNAMVSEVAAEVGAGWSELAYVNDPQKNNFRQSKQGYGVRALSAIQLPGVTKHVTFEQTFEVVLTKRYIQQAVGDGRARDEALSLQDEMLCIHKRLVNNKAGLPAQVMNVDALTMEDIEFLDDDKVAVLVAQVVIQYRISLI